MTTTTGTALARVAVSLLELDGKAAGTTATDLHGEYVLDGVAPGSYNVMVSVSEYDGTRERAGHDVKRVDVRGTGDHVVNVSLVLSEVPVAMPYGAPPRRTRRV